MITHFLRKLWFFVSFTYINFPVPSVIHSKAIAKGEKSEMERYTLFVG